VKPLGEKVCRSKKFIELKTERVEQKINQFADNTTGFVRDGEDFRAWIRIVNRYEKETGVKVNVKKSSVIFIQESWDLREYKDMEVKDKNRYLKVEVINRKKKNKF
jgi:hypothetical protein